MSHIHGVIFTILGVLVLASCGEPEPKPAARGILTILQTTDLHSYIFPEEMQGRSGSALQVAAKLRRLRDEAGAAHCLLVDSGDTLQGGLSGTLSRGGTGLRFLEELGYDAWVPGNHDLGFGVPRLAELAGRSRVPVLAGNFHFRDPAAARSIKPWLMMEKAGWKIALIGMQASFLGQWETAEQLGGVEVEKAQAALRRLLPEVLAAKPDLVVLVIHQGLSVNDKRGVNEVLDLMRLFPELDLVLGGHTHQHQALTRTVGGAAYLQGGWYSNAIGVLRVHPPAKPGLRPLLEGAVLPIAKDDPEDEAMAALLAEDRRRTVEALRTPLCHLRTALRAGKAGRDCELAALAGQAMLAASGADLALHGGLGKVRLAAGPLQLEELVRAYPYENPIAVLSVDRGQLRILLEEQLGGIATNQQHAPFAPGFVVQRDASGSLSWTEPPAWRGKERLRVALTSRLAAGAGGRFPVVRGLAVELGVQVCETTVREAVAELLRAGVPLALDPASLRGL